MDCFSQLPDEILIHILSFLTANEAAVTSALSTRWEHLWKLTGLIRISFPPVDIESDSEEEQYERLDTVKSIIYSFCDPFSFPVHEICISDGYSDTDVAPDVEFWLHFALNRHDVSTLNFQLFAWRLYSSYRFPPPRCRGPRNYKLMHLDLTFFRICPHFQAFGNLRSVSLESCKVTDDAFASINRHCIVLEYLKLVDVHRLENLWISSALCKLKHLEIGCRRLKSLAIDSPNLEFLKYEGAIPAASHRIRALKLKEVYLQCDRKKRPSPLALLRCDPDLIIGEVEKLSLELELEIEEHLDVSRPCLLNHVKELNLTVERGDFTALDDLLRASLSLGSLSLSFYWYNEGWVAPPLAGLKHPNLQRIQIARFPCESDHLQLLRYLLDVVVRLEEMEMTITCDYDNDAASVREYIKEEIEDKLPLRAKLVILPYSRGGKW